MSETIEMSDVNEKYFGHDLSHLDPPILALADGFEVAMMRAKTDAKRLQAVTVFTKMLAAYGDAAIEAEDWITEVAEGRGLDPDAVQAAKRKGREQAAAIAEAVFNEAIRKAEKAARPKMNGSAKPSWRDDAISAPDLCDKQFPDVRYVIPGLIPEGVTLLVSRPKLGKSWLLQQLSSSVAQGSITLVAEAASLGDVLHLTLEDGQRRFHRRMKKYFGSDRRQWPARMTIVHKWRRLDQGGIDDIREWCRSVADPTLVTIDTVAKVRPAAKPSDTNYTTDYGVGEQLIALCHEFPGLAIVIAHHDRKAEADDIFDTVSGTLGLTGGVDTIMLLKRSRQGVTLHIQGRDLIDPVEKAVHFDRETGRWMILGNADEVFRSKDERLVIEALRAEADGLSVKDIQAATGIKSRNNLDQLLGRMARDGAIERRGRGVYVAVTPVH